MDRNAITKRRVAPTLRKMKIGDIEYFPAIQWLSLIDRSPEIEYTRVQNFSIHRVENNQVEVTRTV